MPIQKDDRVLKNDKYIQTKEQWLMDRYLLHEYIEKHNQKQAVIQKVLSVQQERPRPGKSDADHEGLTLNQAAKSNNKSQLGFYSYINKMAPKDFRSHKFKQNLLYHQISQQYKIDLSQIKNKRELKKELAKKIKEEVVDVGVRDLLGQRERR